MARTTHVYTIGHVATLIGENPELLRKVASNSDNIDYGEMIHVQDGTGEGITALNRDTMELYSELVPFDPSLAQTMSDRAVEVVRSTDARELLPRVAQERTSVFCRGGRSAGEWHGACAWQDRCWGAAA